jgi:hypothetical protein
MGKCALLVGAVCLLALPAFADEKKEPKKVEVKGKLSTGIVAVGGETTGTEVETKDGKYELDLSGDKDLQKKAEGLDGKEVVVKGTLEVRKGVEVKERKIIKVAELKEAGDKKGGEKAAIKSDVVIEQDDKGGTAKVGETVEIKIKSPVVAPQYRVKDVKVTVSGAALDKEAEVRHTVPMKDGKPLIGGGFESIYVKAKEKGTAKVKVEYKKGDDTHTHEYEIEVK